MNRRRFLLLLRNFCIAVILLLESCSKGSDDDPVEEKPLTNNDDPTDGNGDDNKKLVENVSLPANIQLKFGTAYAISARGFQTGDLIKMVLSTDGRVTYTMDAVQITATSGAFIVPELDGGRYTFYVLRGDKSQNLGTSTVTITGIETLSGQVKYSDGSPVKGLVVSNGIVCVQTDADGKYSMPMNENAKFVYYSTPEDCKVAVASSSNNAAMFYKETGNTVKYDFTLEKLPAVETDFTLICLGDPQTTSTAQVTQYSSETMTDLKGLLGTAAYSDKPAYGLVLGDTTGDHSELNSQMHALTGSSRMVYFTTIGNHDKTGGSTVTPRNADVFCATFGPLNYSFNRGNIHFVSLDDVIYSNQTDYTAGFTDEQIEWLRQDLSFVPKTKTVIVFYHIPLRNTTSYKNRDAMLRLLQGFAQVHLMAGHTHYHENCTVTTPFTIHEHIHGATCGAWWRSTLNTDGTPNGYQVYDVRGNDLSNWYYKPTKLTKEFQIRLHWGDDQFGGTYAKYSYEQGHKIVANIWNADSEWKVEAYEDGVAAGTPTKLSAAIIDAFAAGEHVGVQNRSIDSYGKAQNKHVYVHTLKNAAAQTIEIRATDRFGKVYSQTEIIRDLKTAESYT